MAEFMALTQIPIIIFYGDNIPTEPTDDAGAGQLARAARHGRLWVETPSTSMAAMRQLVHLPEIGIGATRTSRSRT